MITTDFAKTTQHSKIAGYTSETQLAAQLMVDIFALVQSCRSIVDQSTDPQTAGAIPEETE